MIKNKDYSGFKNNIKASITLLAFIAAFGFISSCTPEEVADSKDVNQAKIHQAYWVSYDAGENNYYNIEAQFRFGGANGTTLSLSEPSTVTVNKQEMKENLDTFRGCYYKTKLQNITDCIFTFKDTENKEYINKCLIQKVELKPIKQIETDANYEIEWIGMPVSQKEEVFVVIEDQENNTVIVSTTIVGSETVKLKSKDMPDLIEGKGQIHVYRTWDSSLQQAADDGGKIYSEYKSKKQSIDIVTNKEITKL
ncbi:MAG: hypothetical protein PHP52_06680 [Bacteroidales bacterium]|nr:hypothetical protein [Bacteroidales bacterium]MDD4217231.1 hypothetical protein [Bacteroidales bacterium]MDY0141066.1 hypothetical protein [Bacteroidales bacterium]